MGLLETLRRRRRTEDSQANVRWEGGARRLPDPAKAPTARGTWDEAALTNVDITEVVKRQIGTVTPPWKK